MGIRNAVQASTNCYAKANGYTNFVDKVILHGRCDLNGLQLEAWQRLRMEPRRGGLQTLSFQLVRELAQDLTEM